MSNTLAQIKTEWIKARKEKHEIAAFIGTLVSDAAMIAKNAGKEEPTEEEVVRVLKKHLKGIVETLEANPKATAMLHQKNFIERFLPQVMSEDELRAKLEGQSFANMGAAMGYLKSNFGAQVDMKMASSIVKEFI